MNISPDILASLRKDRGWSQEKLATISGLSERTIQRAERDGSCSLETKLALSSALDISPISLLKVSEYNDGMNYVVSWSGVIGLFILGLLTPLIAIATAVNGKWELVSLSSVGVLTIVLTTMNFNFRAIYNFFDKTSWIVKYPSHAQGLNQYILIARSVINNCYVVGIVMSLVTGLFIVIHLPNLAADISNFLAIIIRPTIYAILFIEFWIRPYKKRLEEMLALQVKFASKHHSLA